MGCEGRLSLEKITEERERGRGEEER